MPSPFNGYSTSMTAAYRMTELPAQPQGEGDEAWGVLMPIVYDELRQIARRQLRRRSGHTLNTTALVHEAYFKLAGQASLPAAERAHFFGIAARAMRQVLIDAARRHSSARRGGSWQRLTLDEAHVTTGERAAALIDLDDALTRLAATNERLARVVECRFFGGMTEAETAAALGVTDRTVRRDWIKARLWLYGEITADAS
jgi:RNA polymerase sigma factor (TIGR02999 family)